MKRILTFTALLTAASFANAAETAPDTGFFLAAGPSFGYFGNDFETSVGANLTVGIKLRNQHSIEFEASTFDSALDFWSSIDATFVPLLGKYRVPFTIDQKLTLSVAGVAGGMYEKLEGWYFDRTDGAFVVGAEAAIDYAVAERFNVGAGLTALYATETDITTGGVIALVSVRASYRF